MCITRLNSLLQDTCCPIAKRIRISHHINKLVNVDATINSRRHQKRIERKWSKRSPRGVYRDVFAKDGQKMAGRSFPV